MSFQYKEKVQHRLYLLIGVNMSFQIPGRRACILSMDIPQLITQVWAARQTRQLISKGAPLVRGSIKQQSGHRLLILRPGLAMDIWFN